MSEDALPEPDRAPGAPHPRETERLLGQARAEAAFLQAYNAERLHHGWLITGPRGVGKATLAWRLTRFLLTQPLPGGMFAPPPPETLDAAPGHPALARIAAGADPGLCLVRRGWDEKGKRLRQEITVDEARRLKEYFALSAPDGGRRVAIIDAADELNRNAANAVLKLLEEPPERTTFFLIAHQPARLLPTIRSRCRTLPCQPLGPEDLAQALAQAGVEAGEDAPGLAALAGGSVGTARRLITLDGLALYRDLLEAVARPQDRARALSLADRLSGAKNAERFDLCLDLLDLALARAARSGVAGVPSNEAFAGEATLLAALAPTPTAGRAWADLAQSLTARGRHGQRVNIDAGALFLDLILKAHGVADAQPS